MGQPQKSRKVNSNNNNHKLSYVITEEMYAQVWSFYNIKMWENTHKNEGVRALFMIFHYFYFSLRVASPSLLSFIKLLVVILLFNATSFEQNTYLNTEWSCNEKQFIILIVTNLRGDEQLSFKSKAILSVNCHQFYDFYLYINIK